MTAAAAFFVRDFQIAWSYRLSFFVQGLGVLVSLLTLRFISDLFAGAIPEELEQYGGDYFSFVLLGVAVNLAAIPLVNSFRTAVRNSQLMGTLEATLATGVSPVRAVLSSGLYPFMYVLFQLAAVCAVGVAMGARYDVGSLPLVAAVLALTVLSFAGIGLLGAAFVIAFNQMEPFTQGTLLLSFMLGGVAYPISVLPEWLQVVSWLLPLTHAVELLRALTLGDGTLGELGAHLVALACAALLFPLGMWMVGRAVRSAKLAGTLASH